VPPPSVAPSYFQDFWPKEDTCEKMPPKSGFSNMKGNFPKKTTDWRGYQWLATK